MFLLIARYPVWFVRCHLDRYVTGDRWGHFCEGCVGSSQSIEGLWSPLNLSISISVYPYNNFTHTIPRETY